MTTQKQVETMQGFFGLFGFVFNSVTIFIFRSLMPFFVRVLSQFATFT